MERDFSKFEPDAIKFAFEEADKVMGESISSFNQITDRSYLAFALYTGILAYYFEHFKSTWHHYIVFVGGVISLIILVRNIFPSTMTHRGAKPSHLIHPWYQSKPNQVRLMMESMLEYHDDGLKSNLAVIRSRSRLYRYSAIVMAGSLALAFLCSFAGV